MSNLQLIQDTIGNRNHSLFFFFRGTGNSRTIQNFNCIFNPDPILFRTTIEFLSMNTKALYCFLKLMLHMSLVFFSAKMITAFPSFLLTPIKTSRQASVITFMILFLLLEAPETNSVNDVILFEQDGPS